MKKAAELITNRGGRTCHAAIVSRSATGRNVTCGFDPPGDKAPVYEAFEGAAQRAYKRKKGG